MSEKKSEFRGFDPMVYILGIVILLFVISLAYPKINLYQKTAPATSDLIAAVDGARGTAEIVARVKSFCAGGEREYKVLWTKYHEPVYARCGESHVFYAWDTQVDVYLDFRFASEGQRSIGATVAFDKKGRFAKVTQRYWVVPNQTNPPRFLAVGPVGISHLMILGLLLWPLVLVCLYFAHVLGPVRARAQKSYRNRERWDLAIARLLVQVLFVEGAFLTILGVMRIEGRQWQSLFNLF